MKVYYSKSECNNDEKKVHDQIIDYITQTDTVLPAVSDSFNNTTNQLSADRILNLLRDADVFIAVDKNPDAQIFNYCDYGIIGDMDEVCDEMIEQLRGGKS